MAASPCRQRQQQQPLYFAKKLGLLPRRRKLLADGHSATTSYLQRNANVAKLHNSEQNLSSRRQDLPVVSKSEAATAQSGDDSADWIPKPRLSRWWRVFFVDKAENKLPSDSSSSTGDDDGIHFSDMFCKAERLMDHGRRQSFAKALQQYCTAEADCAELLAHYYETGNCVPFIERDLNKAIQMYRSAAQLAAIDYNTLVQVKATTELIRLTIDDSSQWIKIRPLVSRLVSLLEQDIDLSREQLFDSFLVLGRFCETLQTDMTYAASRRQRDMLRAAAIDYYSLVCCCTTNLDVDRKTKFARQRLLCLQLPALVADDDCDEISRLFEKTDPQQLYEWYTCDNGTLTTAQQNETDRDFGDLLYCLHIYFGLKGDANDSPDAKLSADLKRRAQRAGFL